MLKVHKTQKYASKRYNNLIDAYNNLQNKIKDNYHSRCIQINALSMGQYNSSSFSS